MYDAIIELRLQPDEKGWIQVDLSNLVDPPATPAASAPFAYVTPDRYARVVYLDFNGHIIELRLPPDETGWIQADLSHHLVDPPATPAVSGPFAYVTPDRVARVLYLDANGHIIELRLPPDETGWIQADLSHHLVDPPATPAVSGPFAYVTPDRVARVLYFDANGHIIELRLPPDETGWIQADLSHHLVDPPATPAAIGQGIGPFAYVTPDRVARVLYADNNGHIIELRLPPDETGWIQADLSHHLVDPPATPAGSRPFAYVTPDRVARVLYADNNGHIIELRLPPDETGWIQADLSEHLENPPAILVGIGPFAYVTPDGVARVVYWADPDIRNGHIIEFRLPPDETGWIQADLSEHLENPPAILAGSGPFAYVTPDGVARVLYRAGQWVAPRTGGPGIRTRTAGAPLVVRARTDSR